MKMKGTIDIRRVTTPAFAKATEDKPAQQRLVSSCKRTLRRRSVKAARSVWSGPRSCVVECRNFIVGAFLLDPGGAVLRRALLTKCGAARPASECGAEGCVDIPGTWESLYLLVRKITGLGRSRKRTSLVTCRVSAAVTTEIMETGRVLVSKLKTSWPGSGTGSLSPLIVALENWETFSGGSQ